MRIETLDLRAFGPFTGKRLDLSHGEEGLHVIFGLNEAGKSSALRALSAALFGIHIQTKDDFVHEYSALRLAMTLRNGNGKRLSFVRRKTRANPLWDDEESGPLPDDALVPFLGGVDADEFERVFGLDHVRLRDGSSRLLSVAEGAGAAIVGAALGISDLRVVREAIESEASGLFSPRASKPSINKGIATWKQLQKNLRDRSLAASSWEQARRDAERSARERDELVEMEKRLRVREAELEFVRRNRPRVARLVDLRTKLSDYQDVPGLEVTFEGRWRAAEEELRNAVVLRDRSQQEEAERLEALQSLPSDFSLLDHKDEIQRLRDLRSVVVKGNTDRDRLRARAETEAAERDRLARELGLSLPVEAAVVEDLRFALGYRERCESLLNEHTRITTSQAELRNRVASRHRELEACVQRLDGSATVDSAALSSVLKAAVSLVDVDGALATLRSEREQVNYSLERRLKCLSSSALDAEDLVSRTVPGVELVADFRNRFDELDGDDRQGRGRVDELKSRRDEIKAGVEVASKRGAIPTEEDLVDTRTRRDSQWRLVQRAWLEGDDVDAEARRIDADLSLPESFGKSIARSDDLADSLRRESDRVAQIAGYKRELEQVDRQLALQEEATEERSRRRDQLEEDWRQVWGGSGLTVQSPAAMKDALSERDGIVDLCKRRVELTSSVDELGKRISTARTDLAAAMRASGRPLSEEVEGGSFASILRMAEQHLEALEAAATLRRDDENERDRLKLELRDDEAKQKMLDDELVGWRETFAVTTRGLPLRDGETPQAVFGLLRQVARIVDLNDKVTGYHERIGKIESDSTDLERQVDAFRATHLPSMAKGKCETLLNRIWDLLGERGRELQSFESAKQQVEEAEESRVRAENAVELAERTLVDLAAEAGVSSREELPEVVRRSNEKRNLIESLASTEEDLLGEGCSVEESVQRVKALGEVEVEPELVPLATEIKKVSREAEAKREQATQDRLEFEAMESETGAPEVAAEATGVAARLRDDIEKYALLVLASHLLGVAVERFRERNEAPMLKYASEYFAGLTRDRYTRIETDVDDKGRPFFLVRDVASSAGKTLDALSDGTRDQLHLALVLGSLHNRFSTGGEPMPLVLDDVLVHFDDERSMAALEVLTEFSQRAQVLLFTHHERIREQASSIGAGGSCFICEI